MGGGWSRPRDPAGVGRSMENLSWVVRSALQSIEFGGTRYFIADGTDLDRLVLGRLDARFRIGSEFVDRSANEYGRFVAAALLLCGLRAFHARERQYFPERHILGNGDCRRDRHGHAVHYVGGHLPDLRIERDRAEAGFRAKRVRLGKQREEIVLSAWDGKDFRQIDLLLHDCASQLSTLTAQHHAYPILHYYHSEKAEQSAVAAVAVLDDALSLLQFGITSPELANRLILREARSSIDSYVNTLKLHRKLESSEEPNRPKLDALREQGAPVRSDEAFEKDLEEMSDHRRKLLGILRMSSRKWPGH